MEYVIEGKTVTEGFFFHSLQSIASETQICRLLDGKKLLIGGVTYQIIKREPQA